jgi:hypothetical protein
MSAGQQALVTPANSAGNSNYDPYYSDVSLLLSMNGSNNSTSFPDSSQNRLTVTANDDAQISTTQSKFGGSSAYFSGTGSILLPATNNLVLDGDFTLEVWLYRYDSISRVVIGSSYPTINMQIQLGSTTGLYNGSGWQVLPLNATSLNTWFHMVYQRQGSTVTIYQNGISLGNFISSTSYTFSDGAIGSLRNYAFDRWVGYMDDLRITKGIARYTANFTPPAFANPRIGPAYDPFYNNVSLLLGMNGNNGSTYFPDNSGSPKAITVTGNTQISTAQWKWGGSSALFDGNGDSLVTASDSGFSFGTGDFTIECWIRPINNTGGIALQVVSSGVFGWALLLFNGALSFQAQYNFLTTLNVASPAIFDNNFHHIAVTRSGTNLQMFIDGVQAAQATNSSNFNQTTGITIGYNPGALHYLNGYIDDLRITKGVARYTGNFTPPIQSFANTGPTADPYYDSVTLLLPMNGTNASTSFIDSSKTANIISVSGNSQLSTTQWKFGGSSAYFDGTGDFIQYPANTNTNFQSSNFTIEFWAYKLTTASTMTPFSMARDESGTGYGPIRIDFMSNGTVRPLIGNGTNTGWDNTTAGTTVIPINTWTHYAIVKTSTSIRQYINGVLDFTFNTTSGFSDVSRGPTIGYNNNADTQFFNGYIDDFRITKGVARYTANFTVPAQPSPITGVQYDNYYDNVSLLLSMNGANSGTSFVDSSLSTKAVTANGNAVTSTTQYKWGVSSAYFDGTGDYLSIPSDASVNFGTGDFTVEAWVYFLGTGDYGLLGGSTNGTFDFVFIGNEIRLGRINVAYDYSVPWTRVTNSWVHVAWARQSGSLKIFVNGVLTGTPQNNTISYSAPGVAYAVGASKPDSGNRWFNGYVDDFRITKGIARYTANFTPPTQAFPDQGPLTDPFYYNTSLLLHMNGTNGSTVFTDASPVAKNVTPSGNAQISTAQFKWGGSSALLDGTGDYLTTTSATNFQWGTSDYTVECWIRWNTVANSGIYHFYPGVPVGTINGTALGYDGANFHIYALGATYARAYAVSTGTWYHVAVVRSSGSVSLYVNGVKQGASITDNTGYGGNNLHIGLYYSTSFTFNGYIDDFRVTNGVARYRNNFTPPQRQYPDQ